MKTIFLVLALAVAVFAQDVAKGEGKGRGEGHFDGNLKFDMFGDSTFKGKLEALVKPITDFFKGFGLNGEVKSEGDGKSGGHLVGEFKFGGRRTGKANAALADSNSESSQGSSQIPPEILSQLPSGIANQGNLKATKPIRT